MLLNNRPGQVHEKSNMSEGSGAFIPIEVLLASSEPETSPAAQQCRGEFSSSRITSRLITISAVAVLLWSTFFFCMPLCNIAIISMKSPSFSEEVKSKDQAVTSEPDALDQKYFVIHVGPRKTATTFIQRRASLWEDTFLKEDNYFYTGKYSRAGTGGPLYVAIRGFKCRDAVQKARQEGQPMPPCMDEFTHALETAGNRSIFMSSEDIEPYKGNYTEWWQAMQSISENHGYKVIVIVAYRRLYEWYPSCLIQMFRGPKKPVINWPNNGGIPPPPLFPKVLSSAYVHSTSDQLIHRQCVWTPTLLESIPSFIETRTFNVHEEGSIRTKFFCDTLPSAWKTCQHCMELDREDHSEPHTNPSTNVWYDHVTAKASVAGLINTTKYLRSDVSAAMALHHEKTLSSIDFPMLCPSREQLQVLLNASLRWEKELMPAMNSEDDHIESFWKRVDSNKYCFVDAEATLQMDEWKTFFRNYS